MVAAQKILVVDDEVLVTLGCRRILAKAGYEVATACTGQEGLNRALEGSFDLAVIDLRLPDLDGMELVRSLRRQRPNTAIVIITGYGTVPSAVEAMRLGVAEYIEKPFTPDELAQAVGRACAAVEPAPTLTIEAELVKDVLRRASRDTSFGSDLLTRGGCVLSGLALSPAAKAAILSGDIAWIEKRCGALSDEERAWLQHRLEAEIW